MRSNAYLLAQFRFGTAENEPATNLQKCAILLIQQGQQLLMRKEGGLQRGRAVGPRAVHAPQLVVGQKVLPRQHADGLQLVLRGHDDVPHADLREEHVRAERREVLGHLLVFFFQSLTKEGEWVKDIQAKKRTGISMTQRATTRRSVCDQKCDL